MTLPEDPFLPPEEIEVAEATPEAPAVTEAGVPVRARVVAAAGSTVIGPLVPAIVTVTVSVAVTVRAPAVKSVAENTWEPLSPPVKV